jgi:transcriptional regulator with XRE-family HTH domain
MRNVFGKQLRSLRESRSISQNELARRLGYSSNGYISDIERGAYIPSEEYTLREMARALDVPFDTLKDMALEARLDALGVREPGFVSLLKDYPRLSEEDRAEIMRAYLKVKNKKNKKSNDGHGEDH